MSNADRNQRNRQDASTRLTGADDSVSQCQASDLKSLLNSIVSQISDADKRHADALQDMQGRLSGLSVDAKSIRPRIPDDFKDAFARIEAGMAELSARIADINGAQPQATESLRISNEPAKSDVYKSNPEPGLALSHSEVPEAPVALRSAQPHDPFRRDEAASKMPAGVDTFDVIESLSGDSSEPWDGSAADALANVYDNEPHFDDGGYDPAPAAQPTRLYAPTNQSPSDTAGMNIDTDWLDKRLSGIAERIEASLADIRPDQSFFALGQRLDQFERSFHDAIENVATRNDLDSVRLIETHMAELVTHLDGMHLQMSRLEQVEMQLAAIAERLDSPYGGHGASFGPGFDPAAIAHAAADEAATRFADLRGLHENSGLDDMRLLIEQSISDARQSEENTAALLDTLQQAMIRLLDRMDAIELGHHQENAAAGPEEHEPPFVGGEANYEEPKAFSYGEQNRAARPQSRFEQPYGHEDDAVASRLNESERGGSVASRINRYSSHAPAGELDAAVAAVATETAGRAPRGSEQQPFEQEERPEPRRGIRQQVRPENAVELNARDPERARQDFIAEARRAKLRIASEEGSDQIVLTNAAPGVPLEELPPSQRPAGKVSKIANDKGAKPSILTPRVAALALALVVAGGAWLFMPSKKSKQANMSAPVSTAVSKDVGDKTKAAKAPAQAAVKPAAKPAGDSPAQATGSDAPPPDANFQKRSDLPEAPAGRASIPGTVGQIFSGEVTTGATAEMPLPGVAIATDDSVSAAEIARANRHNAMASVSGRLGQAASELAAGASPAALAPQNDALAAARPPQTSEVRSSGALDLPPATVGPLSLRLAAANGDPSAEFEVGARLAEGKGTDQNFKEAAKWYLRSASKGFVQAQYRVGTLYERGLGLKSDEERAKDWYRRAAEQGNVKAMHNLAVLSANNKKGSPDYNGAAKWFSEAAEHGLPDSQFNLAVLYENGLGVTGDMRQAYKWLYLAARNGDKEATRRRDILKGKLTADELAQAEELIRTYQPRASDPLANDARTAGESWKRNPANGQEG